MKELLKRALDVLQSYDADEFVLGAEVMRDILAELAKPTMTDSEIMSIAYDFNALPEIITDETLLIFARAIERRVLGMK